MFYGQENVYCGPQTMFYGPDNIFYAPRNMSPPDGLTWTVVYMIAGHF